MSDPLRTVPIAHPSTPSRTPRETRLDDGLATEPHGHGATAGNDEEATMTSHRRGTRALDPDPPRCRSGAHTLYWRAVLSRINRCEHVPCRVVAVDAAGWVTLDLDGERMTGWCHEPDVLLAEQPSDRRRAHLLGTDLVMVGSHAYLLLDAPSPCSYEEPPSHREWWAAHGVDVPEIDDDPELRADD